MENHYTMLIVLLFPIIGAFLSFYIGRKDTTKRNDFIDVLLGIEIITLTALMYVIIGRGEVWKLSFDGIFGLGLYFTLDEIRVILCAMATWIYGIVAWFMKISMKEKSHTNRFYMFYLLSLGMVLAAFMVNNFFNFVMFLVLAMLLIYPMIVHREDGQALKNGSIYLAFLFAGITIIMTALAIIFAHTGSLGYEGIYHAMMQVHNEGFFLFGSFLLIIGFGIFSGVFPLQYLVTRGGSYGLLEASVIFGGLLSKFGVFGMMILAGTLFRENIYTGRFILIIGLLTTIWGLVLSMLNTDIRKILMGINVVTNGFNILGVGLMIVSQDSNGFAMRGNFYMLLIASLSLTMLYMAAMEQVCKVGKYEIKGLIESGKKNKMLAVVCFLACANLGGLPGTFGFLAHSMFFQTIVSTIHSKWLTVAYIILWAFLLTAVTRIFMKLFISKKDETIRMLTTDEKKAESEDEEENEDSPYLSGEFMLFLIGLLQMVIGIIPNQTIEKITKFVSEFFHGELITDSVAYFTKDVMIAFLIVAILCTFFYVNLVHGVFLRAVRNRKNKKLQKQCQENENKKNENKTEVH